MNNTIYGYVRESENQSAETQTTAIQEYGVEDSCVFKDGLNDAEIPAYHLLLEKLRPGDTVVLKSLDRLGYTYDEMLTEWQRITKEHEASIVVLDMPLPETAGALNEQFLSELVYDVMSYVAQTRKDFKRQKQSEGIRAARARGVKFGSPSKKNPGEFRKVREEYEQGKLTVTSAAAQLNISRATFRKWVSEDRAQAAKSVENREEGL
ncbi:MAG: recombinase family protein [Clostridiales bacterium]|nr:recombinase family protein [Clostridiales bacterium]